MIWSYFLRISTFFLFSQQFSSEKIDKTKQKEEKQKKNYECKELAGYLDIISNSSHSSLRRRTFPDIYYIFRNKLGEKIKRKEKNLWKNMVDEK